MGSALGGHLSAKLHGEERQHMTLRWTATDMFAMGDLKDRLTEIERHALKGGPVILTRHGRPVFALVRIDKVSEGLTKSGGGPQRLTKLERDLYDEVFARGERDIASGNLTDWETIERRVDAALARRRKARRPAARRTKRSTARR